ncbi:MAG: Ig-like domain-containing protein, partial [Oscillospiraceae bacterium]|nr:Ig-like domain-containing protein [Oscillospiraceae bacterium]
NGGLYLYEGTVNADTFRWSRDARISFDGGKLNVTGTATAPGSNSLINVYANTYPKLADAASENLWKYINYQNVKADSTEKLLEAMALPVGHLSLTVSGDIVLTEDLTIDSNEHIYIRSAYVAGQDEPVGSITVNPGVKLVNNGDITLGGNLKVSDGAAFVNNGYIGLDGGLVIAGEQADISCGSNGDVIGAYDYELPEAKYLQALIDCGMDDLRFESDYTIDCDIELPVNGYFYVESGATVTIAQGARLTINMPGANQAYANSSVCGTLIINGSYDGPDIRVQVDEGGQVLPESKVVVTREYDTYKFVNVKKVKASSLKLVDNMGNILGSGSVIPVDMYENPSYDLGVSVEPIEASSLANWKSSSTSIAVVDGSGLVTFLKPGSVTITATAKDGSGKSASVKFTVSYKDFAAGAKFTTKLDATSESYGQSTGIGLQLGDSAMLSVFNGSTVLDNSEFTFTSSNTAIATVDETGLVTAEKAGGSATITATLTGDPLGRTAKFTVKTIPAQLEKLAVLPYEGESGFVGVDANGNLCSESGLEPVSYALYVDKIAKGQPARTFRIMASGETAFGGTVEARGMITWSSSNSKLASVKENADGSVYITVKANVDGACTITATSKDASKTQGHIAVYIVEKSPRLGASSVTLDTQKLNLAELALVSSYGNSITGVEYYDAAYNKTGKVYEEKSGRIELDHDAENGTLQLSAAEYLKNQTIKGQLLVHTEEGDYRLNLNVVIKNKAPSVSFKQTAKFNLFRLDSQAEIIPTVKGEEIEDLEFVGTDFVGEWDGEKIAVSFLSTTPPVKPNAKATVKIWLKGYAFPVEKAVTVATVTSKPSLSLVPASGTLNALYGEKDMSIAVYNKTAKADLDLSNVTASLSPASAGTVSIENGRLKFTAAEGYTGGKLSISLKDENWLSPVTLSLTLKVNTNGIVMKLKSSTLTVNRTFASAYSVDIVSSHSNLEQSRITGFAEPLAGSDKLSVWVEEGKVYARILDNSIENGSYTYNVTPVYDGGDFIYNGFPAVKLTVKVVNTQPKITLSKTSLSLNSNTSAAGMETVLTELKAPAGYEIVSCSVSSVAGIVTQADGGRISVSLDTDALPAAGSYSLMVTPTVSDGECQATLNAIKLTVKVYSNAKLSASVSASGKIDAVQRSTSGISYTLTKLSNVVGNVVSAEPTGQHASMFELEELEPNAKGQFRVMLRLKDGVAVSTKASYKVQISYTLDTGIVVNTAVLTVKVSNTSLKLSAVPATQNIYQSQSRTRIVKYRVNLTSPVNAEIAKVSFGSVGLLQRSLVNEATNVWTEISEDGSYVDVYVRIKDTSALSAGKSYTLPLIIEAEGKAENIAATKLSLKLKVLK